MPSTRMGDFDLDKSTLLLLETFATVLELDPLDPINEAGTLLWRRGLERWRYFCRQLRRRSALESFVAALSEDQRETLRVLREWSNSVYCYSEDSLEAVLGGLASGTIQENARLSSYPDSMLRLFSVEFIIMIQVEKQIDQRTLLNIRSVAVRRAFIQQKGRELVQSHTQNRGDDLLGSISSPKTVPHMRTSRTGTRPDLPHYLWDRLSRKTIETDVIVTPVNYTALSHTWGRWREGVLPTVIKGVPWLVPQNTRWDVRDLPERLHLCPTNTRYIWIDLLCIPQEGALPELMQKEIGRQAEIFRNASHVIAWLTIMKENCYSLANVLDFMLIDIQQTHKLSPDSPERGRATASLDQLKATFDSPPLQLYESNYQSSTPYFDDEGNIPFNPWFTSLWTLQEVWLRPDMWLCSLTWSTVNCRHWTPDLFSVIAVIDCWDDECLLQSSTTDDVGYGTKYMQEMEMESKLDALRLTHFWHERSHLDILLNPAKPVKVLLLGDRRQCSGRRAEAIMSAVGVTNWFFRIPYERHEDDLVLGKYPLPFLEEFQARYPTCFFGEINDTFGDIKREKAESSSNELIWINGKLPGSLLPFGRGFHYSTSRWTDDASMERSPETIRDWKIQTSGYVKIPEACVLSSNRIPGIERIPHLAGRLQLFAFMINDKGFRHVDDWVHSRKFEAHVLLTIYYVQLNKVFRCGGQIIARDDYGRLVNMGRWSVWVDEPFEASVLPKPILLDWLVA